MSIPISFRVIKIRERLLPVLILAFASVSITQMVAIAQTTQSPLPKPTGYVNDYAGVIDSATKNRMELTLGNLDREQQIQFAVVCVDTTNGKDIFDYSLAVARGWGIGSKDTTKPSLLLLVAIKDRKYFTQVSRHLEGELPDGLVGQIQREQLVPAFKRGDYAAGLSNTINTYISTVAAKRGFSTDKIFAPGTTAPRRGGQSTTCAGPLILLSIVVIILIALFVINRRGGRGGFGGGGSNWVSLLLLNMLLNSGRRSGSSGWSGGGFGGFGGGGGDSGGGGFGGFGGGGDFGGGGAGGSW